MAEMAWSEFDMLYICRYHCTLFASSLGPPSTMDLATQSSKKLPLSLSNEKSNQQIHSPFMTLNPKDSQKLCTPVHLE
jgi:hypothetical protein